MTKNLSLFLFIGLLAMTACRKKDLPSDNNSPVITKGTVKIQMSNVVGEKKLNLRNSTIYTLPNGDSFSVSLYNYYLSNFVLIDQKGNRYTETESYHLIRESESNSLSFQFKDVPSGNYTRIEFMIGVDSLRNVTGSQSGDLDPALGMIWTWNTGYISAKMEGLSPQSKELGNLVVFHISGFKNPYNVTHKISLDLPAVANVTESKFPVITIQSDLATWFDKANFDGFAKTYSIVNEGPEAYKIAGNYSKMMSISKVENP